MGHCPGACVQSCDSVPDRKNQPRNPRSSAGHSTSVRLPVGNTGTPAEATFSHSRVRVGSGAPQGDRARVHRHLRGRGLPAAGPMGSPVQPPSSIPAASTSSTTPIGLATYAASPRCSSRGRAAPHVLLGAHARDDGTAAGDPGRPRTAFAEDWGGGTRRARRVRGARRLGARVRPRLAARIVRRA